MKRKISALLLIIFTLSVSLFGFNVSAYTDISNSKALGLTARYAILLDADTDTVLYRKSINDRIRPASLTKMMTLLVAYEQNADRLDEYVSVTAEMIDVPSVSSSANLCDGDMISYRDLLYAMMLPSGNDAAKCLAYATSGSEESFAELMNKTAEELGMTGTHYVNAHGFDVDGHYTTVYDLSLLAKKLCSVPELVEVFSSYKYTASVYSGGNMNDKKELVYYNTNTMLNPNTQAHLDGLKGIKTGYTSLAGNCLASYLEKNGRHLIAIVAFSDQGSRDSDTVKLFSYGLNSFDTFDQNEIFPSKRVVVDVVNATPEDKSNGQLELYLEPDENGSFMTVSKDESSKIRTFQTNVITVRYPTVTAPVISGDYVGDVEFVYNSEVIYTSRAYATRTVDSADSAVPDLVSLGIKGKIRISFRFLTNKYFLIPFISVVSLALLVWIAISIRRHRAKRIRSRQRNVTRKKPSSSRPGNRTML